MRPLPDTDHTCAEWALPGLASTITSRSLEFFYSVHTLIRQQVETRLTERTVEVFHRGQRVAARPALWRPTAWHLARPHAERAPAVHSEWNPERWRARLARSVPTPRR